MNNIHMGQLLEKVIRKKGINITELAGALQVSRRTLYNWFKQEVIDEFTMDKISTTIVYDFTTDKPKPTIVIADTQAPTAKDAAYWQGRYLDLLEKYSELLEANFLNK
jgi:hypothetical protein